MARCYAKEMHNSAIAFEFLTPGENIPIGYKKIPLHIIFDVKMDFTRKFRLVAGGHVTKVPLNLTYSSVVSRDSMHIIFLLAALNNLNIVRALYGFKSSGAAWRAHLAARLISLGCTSCLADPDVWMRPALKDNGTPYYEYLIVYIDDVLSVPQAP